MYNAPLDDFRFVHEVLDYPAVQALPGHGDYDPETVRALLVQADAFCREKALPLNRTGDEVGVSLDPATGAVTLPPGFRELYKGYAENGFVALGHDPAYGGGGAPHAVTVLVNEIVTATNKSFSMCPGLSHGLIEALSHHGTDDQRARYLPKLISGEWAGTMCLTEPQAGTDLSLLTTRAEPDGAQHRLTGTKIWITFGEHDLAENIVHLVLARLPDAPQGIKGISVFAVPKILADGTRNGIVCTGLEHKMGIHASPTCVMSLEGAVGELIGEPHRGMRAMFTMMNVARLNVGNEGVALGEIAYQTAREFARERRQGRAIDPARRERGVNADTILVHPDVRRMLLEIKSTNEAMRSLVMWTSMQIDSAGRHPDPATRARAAGLAALLTPVVKSFCTERGAHNVDLAVQICGGAGYTRDWSVEQYFRDLRIAMIYEGTNHVQALDLVGRKIGGDGGQAYRDWTDAVRGACDRLANEPAFADLAVALRERLATLDALTAWLVGAGGGELDGEVVGAVASGYLNAFALVALGHQWAIQLAAAAKESTPFHSAKIKTGRYYFHHVLPGVDVLALVAREGKQHVMALSPEDL
ncbi:MAG: acyl-CoA dehydrogenase [Deltaproteobacteria bacterium]